MGKWRAVVYDGWDSVLCVLCTLRQEEASGGFPVLCFIPETGSLTEPVNADPHAYVPRALTCKANFPSP